MHTKWSSSLATVLPIDSSVIVVAVVVVLLSFFCVGGLRQ